MVIAAAAAVLEAESTTSGSHVAVDAGGADGVVEQPTVAEIVHQAEQNILAALAETVARSALLDTSNNMTQVVTCLFYPVSEMKKCLGDVMSEGSTAASTRIRLLRALNVEDAPVIQYTIRILEEVSRVQAIAEVPSIDPEAIAVTIDMPLQQLIHGFATRHEAQHLEFQGDVEDLAGIFEDSNRIITVLSEFRLGNVTFFDGDKIIRVDPEESIAVITIIRLPNDAIDDSVSASAGFAALLKN